MHSRRRIGLQQVYDIAQPVCRYVVSEPFHLFTFFPLYFLSFLSFLFSSLSLSLCARSRDLNSRARRRPVRAILFKLSPCRRRPPVHMYVCRRKQSILRRVLRASSLSLSPYKRLPPVYVTYFGAISEPCCMSEPMVNQSEFSRVNSFSRTSDCPLHGCGFSHS